jgi:hypothetical protein
MPDKSQQSMLAKIVGAAVALAAAWAAQQAINQTWKAATGHKPPKADDDDGDAGLTEIVIAAAATGAVVAIARVLATRGTATYVAKVDRKRAADAV